MRAEGLPQLTMRSLADQIAVHIAQNRAEAIRIVEFPFHAAARSGLQPVWAGGNHRREHVALDTFHCDLAAGLRDDA